MGRWRSPNAPAKPYITPAGYAALESEAKTLMERRADVVRHLAAAAAEGDRSENAEYQYRKKELREIDRRVGYLHRRMPKLKIVRQVPTDSGKVFFGAWVTVENEKGATRTFRIVGSDESDAGTGAISVDSPVARILMGKSVDEEVKLPLDQQTASHWIIDIRYHDTSPE
jgi:transcription elongation factor GreB